MSNRCPPDSSVGARSVTGRLWREPPRVHAPLASASGAQSAASAARLTGRLDVATWSAVISAQVSLSRRGLSRMYYDTHPTSHNRSRPHLAASTRVACDASRALITTAAPPWRPTNTEELRRSSLTKWRRSWATNPSAVLRSEVAGVSDSGSRRGRAGAFGASLGRGRDDFQAVGVDDHLLVGRAVHTMRCVSSDQLVVFGDDEILTLQLTT